MAWAGSWSGSFFGRWFGYSGGSVAPGGSTGAVVFLPLRAASGLWTGYGVTDDGAAGRRVWLPPQWHTFAVKVGSQYVLDPHWFRFLQFIADHRLGGVNGATLPDVAAAIDSTVAIASIASAEIAAVAQQTQANADAMAATVDVFQDNGLAGAEYIPPAQTYTEIP